MNGKFLLAALAATVIAFGGGFAVYGLLEDYYNSHTSAGALALQKEEPIIWAMIVGYVFWGLLPTYVVNISGKHSFGGGFMVGLILGFFMIAGFDLFFYSYMNMYNDLGIVVVDILTNTVFIGIVGGVAGWVLGRGSKSKPVAA